MVALPTTISPTIAAIDAAVEAAEERSQDLVIRASSIGHPCERHLWYRYRWCHEPEQFDGRKLRLFEIGNVEEDRLVAYLRMAGVTVEAVDPETGDQWEVVALDDHFKGHLDGIVQGIIEAPATAHLLECKTHSAKNFAQLIKAQSVSVAFPAHVAQMQVYMHLKSLTRAFYLAKNKDNDELYAERVRYDPAQAIALMAKAERIKQASRAPDRVGGPDYYLCQAFDCPSYGICHLAQFALRNCRTCLHSSPAPDGRWHCARHDRFLSIPDQKSGCPSHLYLPSLVLGEQIDADEKGETVTYRLSDNTTWIDGAHREGAAA